jgi:hypothetical protein
MDNQFYELRSKSPVAALVGTYHMRIEKEGIQFCIEGLMVKL